MSYPRPPLNILIVEDEALLAMDIEAMIEDSGHVVFAEASTLAGVRALANSPSPDIAFVDIHLADGDSGLDVSALIQRRWSDAVIVFLTANPLRIPPDFAGAQGVIPKPFSRGGLMSAMRYLEEGVCNPPPRGPQPVSFVAAPGFAVE